MRHGALLLLFTALLCGAHATGQSFAAITGRVVDNTQHSTPNLQVRLRPPATSGLSGQIALTDGNGEFAFPRVRGGSYLLEVSQGPYLLYRQTVNVPSPPLNLVVQRK